MKNLKAKSMSYLSLDISKCDSARLQQATVVVKSWPGWAKLLAVILVVISAIWIPLVAFLKAIGRPLLPEEDPSWFPAEELRVYHGITPHRLTRWERFFFNMNDDFDPTLHTDDI